MSRKRKVLVIGTEPPCPRCDLLYRMVSEISLDGLAIDLHHCSYDSPEAAALASKLNKKIGTAKHVAKAAGIEIDVNTITALIDSNLDKTKNNQRPADTWSPELDKMLKPYQEIAFTINFLMTPILVVDGEVKHCGSVPTQDQVITWINE